MVCRTLTLFGWELYEGLAPDEGGTDVAQSLSETAGGLAAKGASAAKSGVNAVADGAKAVRKFFKRSPKCFTAGTMVALSDRSSYRAIEDVEVGDRVLQLNGAACSAEPFTEDRESCRVIAIEFEDPHGHDDTVMVELMRSALHPLWSLDREGWVRAGDLLPGERLKTDGGEVVIDRVRRLREAGRCTIWRWRMSSTNFTR